MCQAGVYDEGMVEQSRKVIWKRKVVFFRNFSGNIVLYVRVSSCVSLLLYKVDMNVELINSKKTPCVLSV